MKNKNLLFCILLLIFCCNNILAQNDINFLYGKWKITDVKSLMPGSLNLSKSEYNQEIKDQNICTNSYVIIQKEGIKYGSKKCRYYDCLSTYFNIENYAILDKADVENLDWKYFEKDEIKRLTNGTYSEKKLKVIETSCFIDYGSEKLKILVLNNRKIILYDFDLALVLKK